MIEGGGGAIHALKPRDYRSSKDQLGLRQVRVTQYKMHIAISQPVAATQQCGHR